MTLLEDLQATADYLKEHCHPECARKMQEAADEIRRLQKLADAGRKIAELVQPRP